MIIQEQINETLIRTYSDQHVYIHGGFPEANYTEAIDPINMNRTYIQKRKLTPKRQKALYVYYQIYKNK